VGVAGKSVALSATWRAVLSGPRGAVLVKDLASVRVHYIDASSVVGSTIVGNVIVVDGRTRVIINNNGSAAIGAVAYDLVIRNHWVGVCQVNGPSVTIVHSVYSVIGDLIGFQLNPSGFYLPTFTLVAGMNGLLAPFMIQWFCNGMISLKKLVIVIGINNVITSLIFTPFLLQFHFGIPILVTMPGRVVAQAVLIPGMAIMLHILIKRLQQSGLSAHCIQYSGLNSGQCTVSRGNGNVG